MCPTHLRWETLIWKRGPKRRRTSEYRDFEKAGVIGSRGKQRTRIRGGVLDLERKVKMLLIRRYGTGFLCMTTARSAVYEVRAMGGRGKRGAG